MSSRPHLSRKSSKRPAVSREIEDAFLGLAFKLHPQPKEQDAKRDLEYAIVVHDGTGIVEGETFTTQVKIAGTNQEGVRDQVKRLSGEILGRIREYEADRGVKVCLRAGTALESMLIRQVCMIAMAEPFPEELAGHDGIETFATSWRHLDAIP
jgi:hypothetical protein